MELAQRLVDLIRSAVRCKHEHASDYRFIVEGDFLPNGGKKQVMILGRRCPDCGAIESKHISWVLPKSIRDLARLLGELDGEVVGVGADDSMGADAG